LACVSVLDILTLHSYLSAFFVFVFVSLPTYPPSVQISPLWPFSAHCRAFYAFAACYWGVLGVQASLGTVLPCPGENVRLAHPRRARRHAYALSVHCRRIIL
jgi:hypothetical protein